MSLKELLLTWRKMLINLFQSEQALISEEKIKEGEEDMTHVTELSNYERFPDNIFKPEQIAVDDESYTLYLARFDSLYSLYYYLKADPKLNRNIFTTLSSLDKDSDFAGKPYDEAVEDLIASYDSGYEEFLKLQRDLEQGQNRKIHKYETVRTLAGGHLNIPAYSSGSPLCYETEQLVIKPKFIRIHVALSYYWGTSKQQVLNRAIIITNILKALENAGYNVDLHAFELSSVNDEIINIVVELKKHGERLNMETLYKSLCHVEFLRRILFRVLETLDVQEEWNHGYGHTCDESFTRRILKFNQNDIFFDQPREMGIRGEDLSEDFARAIKHLKLEDKLDVESAKREFREKVKSLKP